MLKGFFKLLIFENPDITLGYNIFGFDDKYIRIRTDIYRNYDKKDN
jgi:DNA polymerase elongation subunit (family B)